MKIFDVAGVRLAADVTGPSDAIPLLLLHSGGTPRSTWNDVVPAVATDHRVYAIDLRGYGDSDRPGKYSFELMRDDVLGVLDQIGADQVDIIGHSLGGTVSWLVAQAAPDRVRRLVIEDTPLPRRKLPPMPMERPAEDIPFDWAALVAVMDQITDPDPLWWPRLPTVTASTLLLLGQEDKREDMVATMHALPDARMVEILVGHHIHREALDEFLAAVVPFLS